VIPLRFGEFCPELASDGMNRLAVGDVVDAMGSPSAIVVRAIHPGDHQRVRSALIHAYVQYAEVLPAPALAAYLSDLIDLDGRGIGAEILVAERDGTLLGTVTCSTDGDDAGMAWPARCAVVRALAVPPSSRGRGVGRLLVETCIERACAAGAARVCLHTAAFMAAAAHVHESLGFHRSPEFDVDITPKLPDAGFSLVLAAYELPLDAMATSAA
jgi:GNAT superfamily N-acetyltransferase